MLVDRENGEATASGALMGASTVRMACSYFTATERPPFGYSGSGWFGVGDPSRDNDPQAVLEWARACRRACESMTRPEHMLNGKHVVFGSGRVAHKERNNNERRFFGY